MNLVITSISMDRVLVTSLSFTSKTTKVLERLLRNWTTFSADHQTINLTQGMMAGPTHTVSTAGEPEMVVGHMELKILRRQLPLHVEK